MTTTDMPVAGWYGDPAERYTRTRLSRPRRVVETREYVSAVPGVRCVRQAAKCGRTASGILLAAMSAVWLTGVLIGMSGGARSLVNLDGLLGWTKIVGAVGVALILSAAASITIAVIIAFVYERVAHIGDRVEALFEWSQENARRLTADCLERVRHTGSTTLAIEHAEPAASGEPALAPAGVVNWTTSVESANEPADAAVGLASHDHVAAYVLTAQPVNLARPPARVAREVLLRADRSRRSRERPGDVLVRQRARGETPWPRGSLEANRRVIRAQSSEDRLLEEPSRMRNAAASVPARPSGHRYAA